MEKRLRLYLLIGCILAANLEESEAAKARHYKFEVAYIYWSPDCEETMMIGINGRFPGPTIRAKAGDTIVVELKNSFYHGHYGMQRAAGLYGSLIVDTADGEKEPFHYDGEHNLLLSDWWHESVHAQMLGLSSIPFRWVGEPQAILINGRGQYNCSLAAHLTGGTSSCKITNNQCAPVVLQVRPSKTYRLRIVSTTSLSSLNLVEAS